jgi:GT2 family glycosyltransferase
MSAYDIIIPVYNNWRYTKRCLESILVNQDKDDDNYGIIVVDDDSEDGTGNHLRSFLTLYSHIRYYKNEVNSGFAATCNHGAAKAQGKYLIFLNNDTIVTPGWQKHLVDTISADRDIWVAGAKCIYPDGTLQHAGVAFPEFHTESLDHLYKSVPRYFPLASYLKEYQCVTGACFIIRREDFQSLGGFNEAFRNGFEDVDLCLRIKEQGKKILYQPLAEIIHYESKSDGRLDAMEHNKNLLYELWKGKIRPDETEHFRNDLMQAIAGGKLVKRIQCLDNDKTRGISVFGGREQEIQADCRLNCKDTAARIILTLPVKTEHDYVLIAGELASESRGTLAIKYLTGQELFYSDTKSVTRRIFSGNNVFYFPLYKKYVKPELLLEFSHFSGDVTLKSLDIYEFDNGPKRETPGISIIVSLAGDKDYLNSLVKTAGNALLRDIHIDLLVLHPERWDLSFPDLNIPSNVSFSSKMTENSFAGLANEFINASQGKYILSVTEGVVLSPERIQRFLEIMETDPEIGAIHPGIAGLISLQQPGILDESRQNAFSLKGMKDVPIFFRKSCWEDAGGFDPGFRYYLNLDLCFSILSTKNWRSYGLEGLRSRTFRETSPLPSTIKDELVKIREAFYRKHAMFLIELAARPKMIRDYRKKAKAVVRINQHATLLGSLKVHLRHFIRRFAVR